MITLTMPSSQECAYGVFDSALIGPFGPGGPSSSILQKRSTRDFLFGIRDMYHENDVVHTQVEATVRYEPILADSEFTPYPTNGNPCKVTWSAKRYGSSTPYIVTPIYGYPKDGDVTWSFDDIWTTWKVWYITSPYTFSVLSLKIRRYWRSAFVGEHYLREFSVVSLGAESVIYDTRIKQLPAGYDLDVSFSTTACLSRDKLEKAAQDKGLDGRAFGAWSRTSTLAYQSKNLSSVLSSPTACFDAVDAFVKSDLSGIDFPIEGKDYGDLAMEASQKKLNQVNMIAFVLDALHPSEMIPKLQNLRNLKGLADNYLTVNYGILPTVSDIQKIWDTLLSTKPYFDKNGFSTYSAGNAVSMDSDGVTFRLEQHIKLAIADEESFLNSLVQRADQWGFLPTLTNLWDLVPYSFVLDWFIDVGGWLEKVDTRLRLESYDIRYVTSSWKEIRSRDIVSSKSLPLSGTVEVVEYHRWVSDQCPLPPLSLETTFQDFDHWLESGSLIVQRASR